jgi:hypothetical protein
VVRHESWTRPAGESPVRVSVGAPGSRPQSRGETPAAERGVESLFGGSKRAGCDCSLVRFKTEEPSRSCHGEGHVRRVPIRIDPAGPPGVGGVARAQGLGRNMGDPSAQPTSGKDRPYKPSAKRDGGQRESEGVVVVPIGVHNNAPGAKGPRFDHACCGGKR